MGKTDDARGKRHRRNDKQCHMVQRKVARLLKIREGPDLDCGVREGDSWDVTMS